ncbi:MAG TPA: ADP-ribosylglycohydrolase family protein [Phycisphaerae bacterium]|nr:ADP-ribosylglycohydrolase family protein [Phycisphaerae bacterium]
MSAMTLGRREFRDKVYACWLGKSIGGTLGGPWEGQRHTHALEYYEPVPDKAAPNDDLDLQLVWLKMLEEQGVDPSVRMFADYWSRYAKAYPWNEYGFFMRNFARGLRPPVAGCFENYFVDEMGSPIRSEIWACLHAGDPQAAARMAWKDSTIDHAGGEGTCGEMFWAAVEAAAFVERDPMTLIRVGLGMIPLASHLARSIREAVWCHENGLTWGEARERIATRFAGIQPCHAVPNAGFTIIGWLYGKDFGDRICKAVNCGYDTDCTGATLGALLGILEGTVGIPAPWRDPVGDRIVLHRFTGPCDPPGTLEELTDRTVALAEQAADAKPDFTFGEATHLPDDWRTRVFRNELAREALGQDNHAGVELLDGCEVWLHYGGDPVLRPGIGREVHIGVEGDPVPPVDLTVPHGWACRQTGPASFLLSSPGPVENRNMMTVSVGGKAVAFTMLGPGEATGYAAAQCVPICPRCQARTAACICEA